VEAAFNLSSSSLKNRLQDELDIKLDSELILGREMVAAGSSRAFANGRQIALSRVRAAAALLTDLHSQLGHRGLLDIEQHLQFLDSFAGLEKAVDRLKHLHSEYNNYQKQLTDAQKNAVAMKEKLELINFQINELTKADIQQGEETKLESERKRLESVRSLMETGQQILLAFSETDNSILTTLSHFDKLLRKAVATDDRLAADANLLSESVVNLNEMTRNIESYLSRLEDNPARLEEINARLAELYRLRKKYDCDEAGLLGRLEELQQQSLGAHDFDTLIANLEKKLDQSREDYFSRARDISEKRKIEAARLEKKIVKQLTDLAITRAKFKIEFQTERDDDGFELDGEKVKAHPHGLENIEFMISTNPNEPIRPLVKIASGGELSRIMLALLSVIAGKYRLPTIIFDEIDTGIGGATAVKLAKKLKDLSKKHQVIAISHLPAVASQADHHLAVTKSIKSGRNVISVTEVTGPELEKELERMSAYTAE
jgi:DNA repair protein RecN (Recombination protein N)